MLYIVSTPIGNLDDITLRALNVLKSVDLVACEDTRHTKILFDKYGIKTKLTSYHQHSKDAKTNKIIDSLANGEDIALVSDAGTPGISDPGQKLIFLCIEKGIEITSVPGPSAFTTALSLSGFDSSQFLYLGFLPHKKGRETKLKMIAAEKRTVVLYESVHRIKKLLRELSEMAPEKELCVTRELTKKFEDITRGKAAEIVDSVKEKGEFVVVIEGLK